MKKIIMILISVMLAAGSAGAVYAAPSPSRPGITTPEDGSSENGDDHEGGQVDIGGNIPGGAIAGSNPSNYPTSPKTGNAGADSWSIVLVAAISGMAVTAQKRKRQNHSL